MKVKQKGITTIELMVVTGMLGVVTTLAVVGYQYQIPKAQATEVVEMMETQKLLLAKNIQKGVCNLASENSVVGRYGVLKISGSPIHSEGDSCPTGCKFTYSFNSDVHKALSGKSVDVSVLGNLKLSKTTATTLNSKYLPTEFGEAQPITGDNCAAITETTPSVTNGTNTGTETGEVNPSTPPGGGTDPGGGTNPGGTTPTDPSTPEPPDPSGGEEVIEHAIIKSRAYMSNSINGNTGSSAYQVNYTAYPFDLISEYDRRGGFRQSVQASLRIKAPVEAKYVDIKITLANGAIFKATLRHKGYSYVTKSDVFMYKSSINFDCRTESNCWNAILSNDRISYAPYNYATNVHLPFENFLTSYLPMYIFPPNPTFYPFDTHSILATIEYTMYK